MIKRLSGLEGQERLAFLKLQEAFEIARNRHSISLLDRQIIRPSEAGELNAANPRARALLGHALWSEFSEFFGLCESQPIPDAPLYWLTLADIGCMTALDAKDVNVAGFIRHLRTGLEGLSYLGLVDLALYANIQPGTRFTERTGGSWHLHLFAWGEEPKAMKCRVKQLNKLETNYRSIAPDGKGAHRKRVTEENIERLFRYTCKTPRKEYSIGREEFVNSGGGTEFSFTSNKRKLRPGGRITLFHLLKGLSLDQLLVAGGEGVSIRRRGLRQTRRT